MNNLEFEKQQQKLEQETQKSLDNCFNNPNEKNKMDLFLLLIKNNGVKSIINKKSIHAPVITWCNKRIWNIINS
jgi:hypothetical protein